MKKIESIIKKKNGEVDLVFFDGEIIHSNIETFTDYYLYENKEISDEIYNEIVNKNKLFQDKKYAVNLLMKKSYSEFQIKEKLAKRHLSNQEIAQIISYLKEYNYLNDEAYFKEFVSALEKKGYGYYRINEKLNEVGIDIKYDLDEEKEKSRALEILPQLVKKYSLYSVNKMKDSIFNSLMYLGYENEIVKEMIDSLDVLELKKQEIEKLKKDYYRLTYRYSDSEKREKRDLIINKLKMKGYQYSDIIEVLNQGEIYE